MLCTRHHQKPFPATSRLRKKGINVFCRSMNRQKYGFVIYLRHKKMTTRSEAFQTCEISWSRHPCLWHLIRQHYSLVIQPVSRVTKMTTDLCGTLIRGGRAESWPASTSLLTNPTATTTIELEFIRPVFASCEAVRPADEAVWDHSPTQLSTVELQAARCPTKAQTKQTIRRLAFFFFRSTIAVLLNPTMTLLPIQRHCKVSEDFGPLGSPRHGSTVLKEA